MANTLAIGQSVCYMGSILETTAYMRLSPYEITPMPGGSQSRAVMLKDAPDG